MGREHPDEARSCGVTSHRVPVSSMSGGRDPHVSWMDRSVGAKRARVSPSDVGRGAPLPGGGRGSPKKWGVPRAGGGRRGLALPLRRLSCCHVCFWLAFLKLAFCYDQQCETGAAQYSTSKAVQKGMAAAAAYKSSGRPAISHRVAAPDLAKAATRQHHSPEIDQLGAVLFLDVDGVLHSPNPKHARLQFRASCMELLRDVCSRTGAKLVLSTSWRLHADGRSHLAAKLNEFGCPPFVSRTPSIAQFQRPKEILAWVSKHKPLTWVAVDDWPLHEDARMSGHFVQTRNRYGLQEDTAARICALFEAQRDPSRSAAVAAAAGASGATRQ
jgi:hypothetical protein